MTAARVNPGTAGDTMHIAVSGEVDLGNAAAVEHELRAALAHRPRAVAVDLRDLTSWIARESGSLSGWQSVVKPLRIMMMLIVPLDSPIRRLIELPGLDSFALRRRGGSVY